MILPIITHPADILRVKTVDLPTEAFIDPELQELIDSMIETMYAAQGIGIAAPQIDKDLRVCIIGKEADDSLSDNLVLVNPVWQRTSRRKKTESEGCLSIPNTYGKVTRWKNIHVEARDRHGNPLSFDANDFFARVIQHEVDHLDGVLFIDKAKDVHEVEPS